MTNDPAATIAATASPTLDELFARTLARNPDAPALRDPLNKARVTGGAPACLTYAQADRAIDVLAGQLTAAGLPAGSIIAVQLPNTVEFPLTLLAAWRAGLVVAVLPQLWRHAELSEALNRIGARAIISASRIEIVDHADLAMNAAVEAFSVRHVFGFGQDLPDGMTPLDWTANALPCVAPAPAQARKAAIVSFDVTAEGLLAVPRSHIHLMAGGLSIVMACGLPQGAAMMSTVLPSSFGALVCSMVTWLLTGGSLSLHHPFDPQVLDRQIRDDGCDTLVAPAHLALRLGEAGAIDALPALRHVVGLWRTPERAASSTPWQSAPATLSDIYLFGEIGLFGARRQEDGAPAPIPIGTPDAERAGSEVVVTPHGTLALRGAMVAGAAYRSGFRDEASLTPGSADSTDTLYAARHDKAAGTVEITAPPPAIACIGGYRFRGEDLERWAARLAPGTTLTALPDPLNGHRLAGRAGDNAKAREALAELGLSPLMTEAFRARRPFV